MNKQQENLPVGIVLLHPDAKMPVYSTEGAAGCDLHSVETVTVHPDKVVPFKHEDPLDVLSPLVETTYLDPDVVELRVVRSPVIVHTGVAFHLNESEELAIRGRSGLGFNYDVVPFYGTIDEDYTGEVKVKVYNNGQEPFKIEKGMRFAQGVISHVLQKDFESRVDGEKVTVRGDNGFAHTGLMAESKDAN